MANNLFDIGVSSRSEVGKMRGKQENIRLLVITDKDMDANKKNLKIKGRLACTALNALNQSYSFL